jgi:hypothetical protein
MKNFATRSFSASCTNILCGIGVLCFFAFATATTARADEVTVTGTTSGSFQSLGGVSTGETLMGLRYVNSSFDAATVNGARTFNGAAASPSGARGADGVGRSNRKTRVRQQFEPVASGS